MSDQSNLKVNRKSDLQVILYYDFHIAKKYRVDSVAQKAAWHPDTLYKKINGELPLTADDIIKISIATGNQAYIEFMADKIGYRLVRKIKDGKCTELLKAMAEMFLSASGESNGKGE